MLSNVDIRKGDYQNNMYTMRLKDINETMIFPCIVREEYVN